LSCPTTSKWTPAERLTDEREYGFIRIVLSSARAVAAGALLTMVADTMIPEAVEGEHGTAGLLVVLGSLLAFGLSHTS